MSSKFLLTVQEETETNTCIHFLPPLCSFPCTFLPFSTIPPFCLFLILFFFCSFRLPFFFFPPPPYLPPCSPLPLQKSLDVFYVQPDPDCSPDDPLWFSSTPLDRRILESLLIRILLVRDIYSDKQLLEENTEENTEEEGGGETVGGE